MKINGNPRRKLVSGYKRLETGWRVTLKYNQSYSRMSLTENCQQDLYIFSSSIPTELLLLSIKGHTSKSLDVTGM